MEIKNSTIHDLEQIFDLYKIARGIQIKKGAALWPEFDKALIETEIFENRQWKNIIDNQVACIWATTFSDPQIWEERNSNPAVYIHRIVTNPVFKGQNLVGEIVTWARNYAKVNGKDFIRMDTVGENNGLINYYQKCGFDFLGLLKLKNTDGFPAHYINAAVSLFQITIE